MKSDCQKSKNKQLLAVKTPLSHYIQENRGRSVLKVLQNILQNTVVAVEIIFLTLPVDSCGTDMPVGVNS